MNTSVTAKGAFWISLAALAMSMAALTISVLDRHAHQGVARRPTDTRLEEARTALTPAEVEQNKKDMERASSNEPAAPGNSHSNH